MAVRKKRPGPVNAAQQSLALQGASGQSSDVIARPWIFARVSPPRPSKVLDTYWRFAVERQNIFFRRLEGRPAPWTADPVLRRHRFTNVFRASDRVSQYLIRNVVYRGPQSAREVFFRTLLFKIFNRIETWKLLQEVAGEVSVANFDVRLISHVLDSSLAKGDRIYSGAYIVPPATRFGGGRKHDTHLRLLSFMLAERLDETFFSSRNLQEAYSVLRQLPGIGNFLAYQFAIDLNYSALSTFDEDEFVMPGPGARDGIRKCFVDLGGFTEADVIRAMVDRQEAEFDRLGLRFQSLWGRRLHLIDCQNVFCELDKYARITHPDVTGISGRTRIKQIFKPTAMSVSYMFPPKWGILPASAVGAQP